MSSVRASTLERLRQDAMGPMEERETLADYPSDVYLTGILFPQQAEADPAGEEKYDSEGDAGAHLAASCHHCIANIHLVRS